jgi:hypothetical protein
MILDRRRVIYFNATEHWTAQGMVEYLKSSTRTNLFLIFYFNEFLFTVPNREQLLQIDLSKTTQLRAPLGFVARRRRRAWIQGAQREDSADVLVSTSRSLTERNTVDMPGCAAAVEIW